MSRYITCIRDGRAHLPRLGKHQRVILDCLSDGDWWPGAALCGFIDRDSAFVRGSIRGLRNRGFLIDADGHANKRGYRMLCWPDKPWLPLAGLGAYYDVFITGEFNEAEIKQIVLDHLATHERRQRRIAA